MSWQVGKHWAQQPGLGQLVPPIQRPRLDLVFREAEMLAGINDPNRVYSLCDSEVA